LEDDLGCLPFSDLALFDILEMTNKALAQNIERITRKTKKSRRFREKRDYTLTPKEISLKITDLEC